MGQLEGSNKGYKFTSGKLRSSAKRKQNGDGSVFHPCNSHSLCCSRPCAYNKVQQPRATSLDETIPTHSAKCDVPNGIRRFVEHEVRREGGASLPDSCSELVQANY